MAGDDLVELKFRLFDETDIGPNKYDPSTTVGSLKEIILDRWPSDKEIAPKTINDVKIINGGKILENNRTIAESRVLVGELPGGVITMHVVVRPPAPDANYGLVGKTSGGRKIVPKVGNCCFVKSKNEVGKLYYKCICGPARL